jgi:hypothetical protein
MIKVLGEHYFLDLDAIEDYVEVPPNPSSAENTENTISVTKYEMVKMLMEVLMTEKDEVDETLGNKAAVSIPFKIAFNTLINKKLIDKY